MKNSKATDLSLLNGTLVSIKDNFATMDEPHRSSSRILEGYKAPYDATVVARLKSAGAVLLGRVRLEVIAKRFCRLKFNTYCRCDLPS
jgi:aspartyl-tRNA(Asn)/glutamyl-tRNA(Gln) amidotransferase subunit A